MSEMPKDKHSSARINKSFGASKAVAGNRAAVVGSANSTLRGGDDERRIHSAFAARREYSLYWQARRKWRGFKGQAQSSEIGDGCGTSALRVLRR